MVELWLVVSTAGCRERTYNKANMINAYTYGRFDGMLASHEASTATFISDLDKFKRIINAEN